jgi:hypothetical protein
MTETNPLALPRSYGCTWGCGNAYDYVVVSVADGTAEFLCLPCFLKLAEQIITAVTSPEGEETLRALAEMAKLEPAPMTGDAVKPRGHNAPATAEDPDLLEAFDTVITVDELPDEFK